MGGFMERVFAFVDESGAFGWDLANPSVTKYFILTAVIVDESKLTPVMKKAEEIRKKYFQTGEMKSTKLSKNFDRRMKLLSEIATLDCKFFPLVCDKEKLANEHFKGFQYKQSFYKFLNNIIDTELTKAYSKLTIVLDSTGSNEFIESFTKNMKERVIIPDLFGESDIQLKDSKSNVLIQVADIISGTLQIVYDKSKGVPDDYNFLSVIDNQLIRIEKYPKTFDNYNIENCTLASEYDIEIANICFQRAKEFIFKNENNHSDLERKAQVLTLKYLLFRFMNNNSRGYISTTELRNHLKYSGFEEMSEYHFRTKVIGKLRDYDVIIASSPKGYKIPSNKQDLINFMEHNRTIILPMLTRLKKCRNLIQLGTKDKLDLFKETGFEKIKTIFDAIDNDIPSEM